MPFDLSSAQPVSSGFDLASAKPVQAPTSYSDRVAQTGAAFDKAAGSGLGGIARTGLAAGENALSMLTAIPADVTGAATSMLTQNPARGASVRSAMTYQPKTDIGKAGQDYIGSLVSPLASLMNKPVQALNDSGHPILAQGAQAAEDVVPLAGPKLLGAAAKFLPKAGAGLAPEVTDATNAGFKLTPQQAGGPLGQALQSLTGSAKLERSVSLKNAPQVNKLGAQELGIPDLSDASLTQAKAPAIATYTKAKTAGPVQLLPQDFASVQAPGTLQDPAVQALQAHYANMGTIDASDLVADMRKLRADGPKNIKAPNAPSQNDLGWAQKAASDALEGALDRHLQAMGPAAPVDINDFRNARVQLAKVHSVEDAMDGSNLSAKELAKQLNRNVPLSGNLRTIAQAYNNFDRSFQAPSGIRDSGPFGALDTSVLGLSGGGHPLAAASVLAKPLVRAALASGPGQALSIRNAPLLSPAIAGLLQATGKASPGLSLMGNQQPRGGLLQ